MNSDDLQDDNAKDGLVTAIIESYPHREHAIKEMTDAPMSWGSMTICEDTFTMGPTTKTEEYPLELAHGGSIVIGRQEGGGTEYLDPHYRPTQRMPGTQRRIVISHLEGKDVAVSRGHFMLVGSPLGILFVNGVPRRGGGIRPPINGTLLLEPAERSLGPGEELQIERGQSIKIRLPNYMEVLIAAA